MEEGEAQAVQVCVRVRPLNGRELTEGHRACVSFDEPTKQVVLTAVDKNTLLQLRGAAAKGYAFDRRYSSDATSDDIYDDCIAKLVESCFKGYNGTVLAYGQTGSGKTHTMSGGVGIHGKAEEGITPRVIRHLFIIADQLRRKAKPGEKVEISASALELYNEDLLDLSQRSGRDEAIARQPGGWDTKASAGAGLKLQERPVGKDGRVIPEVLGLFEQPCESGEELQRFYADCMENRSVSSTKLNEASSRSHALFTITINRTQVEVLNELGEDMRAKVRTVEFSSKLHLVDLAGSERVKRSGVTGKELKEATHINSGLLALGNVIVALSTEAETKKKSHVPYRDSKLTRLLQDSLGGNSLTVLISCISPSEMDFEETNNTLKYANRACSIKNTPLPSRYTQLEEDLLPSVPMAGGMGLAQLQALLEDHEKLKEIREKKDKERKEKEARRMAELVALRDEQAKMKGFQRLRASQYDELRRQLAGRGVTIPSNQVIADDVLVGFGRRENNNRLSGSMDGLPPVSPSSQPNSARSFKTTASRVNSGRRAAAVSQSTSRIPTAPTASSSGAAKGQSFADWLAAQQAAAGDEGSMPQGGGIGTGSLADQDDENGGLDFIVEDDQVAAAATQQPPHITHFSSHPGFGGEDAQGLARPLQHQPPPLRPYHPPSPLQQQGVGPTESVPGDAVDTGAASATMAASGGKSKFRRAAAKPGDDEGRALSHSTSAFSIPASDVAVAGSLQDVQPGASEVSALEAVDHQLDEEAGGVVGNAEEGRSSQPGDADVATTPAAPSQEEGGPEVEAGPEGDSPDSQLQLEEEEADEELPYDPIEDVATPKLLARFKVNTSDVLSVFKAVSKEDFEDVVALLPPNTPLPASDKMTYLLARLETIPGADIEARLVRVATGQSTMNEAVGPAVGCLMATFGTNMISSCIFEFPDPPDLKFCDVEERIELWGLQIPHNSVRQQLQEGEVQQPQQGPGSAGAAPAEEQGTSSSITWTSVDRLNMSIGLLYALCNHALDLGVRAGFCVPRPQLLKRWMQAGVRMKQITGQLQLIYPPSAHDYQYYKASTVAYFMINEVRDALNKVLAVVA